MKKLTNQVLLLVLMLWASVTFAQQNQGQVVVQVKSPGTLSDDTPTEVWEGKVRDIKIVGTLNSTDLRTVRQFCGSDEYGGDYPHEAIRSIDLSEVKFTSGGIYYLSVSDNNNGGALQEFSIKKGEEAMLPERMFWACTSIESIVLPNSIDSIGVGAFWKAIELKNLSIPNRVKKIHSTAFGACNKLEHLTLPSQLESLGGYAFSHCKHLKSVTIPKGVKKLGIRVFEQTDSLATINLPEQMNSFDPECFFHAIGLKKIKIPEGIKEIPRNCFSFCDSLQEITFSSTVESIGNSAFQSCKALKSINFAEGLKFIERFGFIDCSGIESIKFPNSLQTIDVEAFRNCKSIKTIDFGKGIEGIGELAFFHNHALKRVVFPESLKQIDFSAFGECESLEEVELGKSSPEFFQNPFLGCKKMKRFIVDKDNKTHAVINNALCTADGSILLSYPNMADTAFKMGDKVKGIDDFSFWFCDNLKEVTFSPAFTSFGDQPFHGCVNIKKMTINNPVPVECFDIQGSFDGLNTAECEVYVPKGSLEAFKKSPMWSRFNLKESTSGIDQIGIDAGAQVKVMNGLVQLSDLLPHRTLVMLTDLAGHSVLTMRPATATTTIDVAELGTGTYILTLVIDGKAQSQKIVL